jgi:Ca2+-dependent lipid-binding protein
MMGCVQLHVKALSMEAKQYGGVIKKYFRLVGKDHVMEGTLTVHVLRARGLVAMDKRGSSDPFTTLTMSASGKKEHTRVIKKTLEPQWDEIFELKVRDRAEKLVLKVFDKDMLSRDDLIGELTISVKDIEAEIVAAGKAAAEAKGEDAKDGEDSEGGEGGDKKAGSLEKEEGAVEVEAAKETGEAAMVALAKEAEGVTIKKWFKLEGKQQEVKLASFEESLTVKVVQARALLSMDSNGKSDPFVVVATSHGGEKHTTKVAKKTLDPRWDEQWVLKVNVDESLTIKVFDKDRFRSDSPGLLALASLTACAIYCSSTRPILVCLILLHSY